MRRTWCVTTNAFFDDLTGQSLDKRMAREARKLEMQFFRNMEVCDRVPRWTAARDSCKVITTRCLDINKGDQRNPNCRARQVSWGSRRILVWTYLLPPRNWSPSG